METPTNQSPQNSNTVKQVITTIALVVVILLVVWFMKNRDEAPAPAATEPTQTIDTETPTTENTTSEEPATPVTRRYANGTYSATGNYISPAGTEEIDLTITVKDDVVVSAQFTGKATHQTSQFMQGKFKDGFSEMVVGKTVDSVNLTVVNGSSLTPKGFMEALNKIKGEANS